MRQLRPISVLAAVFVLALALAACGGDDSPEQPIEIPTETTSSLTQEEFITEADAICAEANAAINTFAESGQGVTAADEIADLRQSVVDDINALGPPADDSTTLEAFLTAMEGQVEAGRKIGLAVARESDTTEFEAELQAAKDEAATAASSYGFEDCGSASVTSSTAGSTDSSGTVTPAAPVAPAAPAPSDGGVSDPADTGGDTGDSGGGVSPGGGISP